MDGHPLDLLILDGSLSVINNGWIIQVIKKESGTTTFPIAFSNTDYAICGITSGLGGWDVSRQGNKTLTSCYVSTYYNGREYGFTGSLLFVGY